MHIVDYLLRAILQLEQEVQCGSFHQRTCCPHVKVAVTEALYTTNDVVKMARDVLMCCTTG
jgi:hypothetical protein